MGATGGFVGRDAELAALNERLRSALDGTGQVVLIAGEPGVGKTRLAGEIAIQARELGLAHGSGRATEDKGSPPYWPFLQAFRTLGRPAPPELDARDGSPNTTDGSSAHQRFRLFETVTDSLVAEAESGGLLVTLDDVQWADPASLLLLVHLAMALPAARARMLVLVTYRDTETTGQEHLRTAIGSLARESAVTRLRLTGLSESEVAAYLAGVTGWAVPATVAAAVCRRTQGNPFFVGELGRVLASSMDGQLPEGVRAAVHDRLARLSTACREMISAAAVLGSTVDPAAVADATGASLVDVLTALDEATKAGIVTEARHFAHDLIREAARHELPTAQRLTLHQRMAAYLGKRADADGRVAEVAYHHLESLPAGDPEAAVVWAERAADRAAVQYAWEEAANLYQRALQAATAHNLADPARQCRMWLAIAAAQVRSFGVAEARESLLEAVRLARGLGDHESIARAVLTMEGVSDHLWNVTGRELVAEALAGLSDEDSALRARLLAMLATSSTWWDFGEATRRSGQALAMAERLGDRVAIRESLRARQMALSGPDGVDERLALGNRMLELGLEGDEDALLWGRLWRFDALAQLSNVDSAEAELGPIAAIADRMRWPVAHWHSMRCHTVIAAARGRLGEALDFAAEAERVSRRAGSGGPLMPTAGMLTLLRLQTGDDNPFRDYLVPVTSSETAVFGFMSGVRAFCLLAAGERDEAHRIYRTLPPLPGLPPFTLLPAAGWLIELAAEFDDRAVAEEAYALLAPYEKLLVCGGAGVILLNGPVPHYLGVAAATLGRLDDAVRHLRTAIQRCEQLVLPPALAFATYELAKVLARRKRPGDRDEASALATSTGALAEQLGMKPLSRLGRELAASLTNPGPGPLTKREHEVAILVSRGLTNRQIAAAAHISERTAETHVQHILEKLGFTSRAQIAAWIATSGRGAADR